MTNRNEPIAIVGIGCRFPGGINTPASFFNFLLEKKDAITRVPADRWNADSFYDPRNVPGKINNDKGGFIDDIDKFDASFFGISPREASQMDPQHRILLEVTMEALEDAGIRVDELEGTDAGVFLGTSSHDYADIQQRSFSMDLYGNIGIGQCVAANRISYFLNIHGPSLVMDTACSSSLTAVHYACHSLRSNECSTAIVGGVNLMFSPLPTLGFSIATMLSPEGQCRPFDEEGKGFVRSEGVGIMLLKPLSKALRDGDNIYAVIAETLVNQDGKTNGITLPNGDAQEKLLRDVYALAGIDPATVYFIECHGTGTPVGDPIEAEAIGRVFSKGKTKESPCYIGSVKSNIGHLEPASGIAGLIKAALAIKMGTIPPNIHFNKPNPRIDFVKHHLQVPIEAKEWPTEASGRTVGVNSFGFGGVNSHVILQEYRLENKARPNGKDTLVENSVPYLFLFSAESQVALDAYIQSMLNYLKTENKICLHNLSYSLLEKRTHYHYRIDMIASSSVELISLLEKAVNEAAHRSAALVPHDKKNQPLVWVFSGQGPQWWKMGRELMAAVPLFRDTIMEIDRLLAKLAPWSLYKELMADETASRIHQTDIAQPALFAIQVALARVWESMGVTPAAVVGHSVGEVAAAYVSGIYTLEEAVHVIYYRSYVQHKAYGKGKMLAVGLSEADVSPFIQWYGQSVSVGAVNGLSSVTLSGDPEILEELHGVFEEQNVFSKFLKVNYAFHSYQMDPYKRELLESLQLIKGRDPKIPFWSTVTGQQVTDGSFFDSNYWWLNVRKPVLFANAILDIIDGDLNNFLEIGPHPVLTGNIKECLSHAGKEAAVVYSLYREKPELATLYKNAAELYKAGFTLRWMKQQPTPEFIKLPSYPWQRSSFWKESEDSAVYRLHGLAHPMLQHKLVSPFYAWKTDLNLSTFPYLADHKVDQQIVFPGAGYVELAIGAAREVLNSTEVIVSNIKFHDAMPIEDSTIVHLSVNANYEFDIYERKEHAEGKWTLRASGRIEKYAGNRPQAQNLEALKGRLTNTADIGNLYKNFLERGFNWGSNFKCMRELYYGKGESLAKISLFDETEKTYKYCIHPTLLDGCFQSMLGSLLGTDNALTLFLPDKLDRLKFMTPPKDGICWSHCKVTRSNDAVVIGDILIYTSDGEVIASITGFMCKAFDTKKPAPEFEDWFYEYKWSRDERMHSVGRSVLASVMDSRDVLTATSPYMNAMAVDLVRDSYYNEDMAALSKISVTFMVKALEQLGIDFAPGSVFVPEKILAAAEVVSNYSRCFYRMLNILKDEGVLRQEGDEWTVTRKPTYFLLDTKNASHKKIAEANRAELELITACGTNIVRVFKGDIDPLSLIFRKPEDMEYIYGESPSVLIYNKAASFVLGKAAERADKSRPLRILEIGAGTGGTTSFLLPALESHDVQYVFTDVSPVFLDKARSRFERYGDKVSYKVLNIENDPGTQGFEENSFDVIIASNVIHATREIKKSLDHAKKLLTPEGRLLLIEITGHSHWFELVFGLTDGWWLFTDTDLRKDMPLLTADRWLNVLEGSGFDNVACINEKGHVDTSQQSLLIAGKPAVERIANHKHCMLIGSKGSMVDEIAKGLSVNHVPPITVVDAPSFKRSAREHFELDVTNREDWDELFNSLRDEEISVENILHVLSLSSPTENTDITNTEEITSFEARNGTSLINLVQTISACNLLKDVKLMVATGGLHAVTGQNNIIQAPIWGLGRTLIGEMPELSCKLVDIATNNPEAFAGLLVSELLFCHDDEDEIAYSKGRRFVHRLLPLPHTVSDLQPVVIKPESVYRLNTKGAGILENIFLEQVDMVPPAPADDEVLIRVEAAGLNFRDVMKAMGIYPNEGEESFYLGDEYAGTIVAAGRDVTEFSIGDQVMGNANWALGSYVNVKAVYLMRKPSRFSFQEAATMPLVYATVIYALKIITQLKKGDSILIHSAAGGVGQAAIQYAKHVGAEIFVTAGTEEKREFLRSQGIKYVMDSHTLDFAEQIMSFTANRGVDFVLNSLAGEAIVKSMDVLAEHGRFIELGKRDIYENKKLGLWQFRKNISYHAVDLSRILGHDMARTREIFDGVYTLAEQGVISPLLHKTYDIADAAEALSFMAQGKHTGKIVLTLGSDKTRTGFKPVKNEIRIDGQASYLITGGLGGFGLHVAQWLAEKKAGHLVLMGRRGNDLPQETHDIIAAMRAAGVEVTVIKGDVSRMQDVKAAIDLCDTHKKPLKGVIHSAMVLDDVMIVNMNTERYMNVVTPKVIGAWNLHCLTQGKPLDFFVLFSSITALFGNHGQANYCAGNYFLDVLSQHRKSHNLPSLSVNWTMLSKVGYVANNSTVKELLEESQGLIGMPIEQALEILEYGVARELTQIGIFHVDWDKFAVAGAMRLNKPKHSQLRKNSNRAVAGGNSTELNELLRLSGEERHSAIEKLLLDKIARIFGNGLTNDIDVTLPLSKLGLDSLMAVELRNWMRMTFLVEISLIELMKGSSDIQSMVSLIASRMEPGAGEMVDAEPNHTLMEEVR